MVTRTLAQKEGENKMIVKKTLSFTEEELQIMNDFSEKVLDEICIIFTKSCEQCPLNGCCYQIANFIETVSENGSWTISLKTH